MKKILVLSIIVLGIVGLTGCYTVPRHYVSQEIIVYYPHPPPPPPDYYYPPVPPSPPVYYPPAPQPSNPPRDRQPEKPNNSYRERDPLQGGSNRGSGEINTVPPVRNPEQKAREQR
ncbi:MAG TPA: hypothetical protein VLH59_11230 [Ignavibacteriaceae bacterium]|nr:hypothetical protein [Ignavibacteriaceae bacterium]